MKAKDYSNYIQANKKHWNAIAECSNPHRRKYLNLIRDGYPYLENVEPEISPYLRDIRGKDIIVPQFGDGLVMLACAKKGAKVTGVDISTEQIRLAKQGAHYCGVDVAIIEADWQKLPKKIRDNSFDIVTTECGIFIWIKSLEAWMKNAYRVLRKGGRLVVSDFHPLSMCTEEGSDGKSVVFTRSYFDQTPQVRHEKGKPPSIEFTWKLSDIINATVDAGFRVDRIEEYYVEEKAAQVPLMPMDFLIVATKK